MNRVCKCGAVHNRKVGPCPDCHRTARREQTRARVQRHRELYGKDEYNEQRWYAQATDDDITEYEFTRSRLMTLLGG